MPVTLRRNRNAKQAMTRVGQRAFTFVAVWAISAMGAAEPTRGYGPWKFRMSKSEVVGVSEYGPYRDVRVTGGVETPNGFFDGERTNLSFIFGHDGLRKIQIWIYEGKSIEKASAGLYRVYDFFRRNHGEVESEALQLRAILDEREFMDRVRAVLERQPRGDVVKLQLAPRPMPEGITVFSSLFRDPNFGYFVFLYYQEPNGR
jgi:hypothetical protein